MFDTVALQTITDIRGYEGRLTCLIPVEPRVQNRYGTLHGGCIGQHTYTMTALQRILRRLSKHVSRLAEVQMCTAFDTLRTVLATWNTICNAIVLAATLVDVVGSAALVTVSEKSGVSLNISVDYLRPGQAGDDVLVEAKVALLSAYAWVRLPNGSVGVLLAAF